MSEIHLKTAEQLTKQFADAVQAQDFHILHGDARSGNLEATKYIDAARELLRRGHDAIETFVQLLSHQDASVRGMAAAFLLEARTELAVAALRPIAAGKGPAALGAQMTLERYARGELRIT